MKISLPQNNEHFSVTEHSQYPWLLIKPQGIKQRWKSGERWWRSTVTDPEGNVLSAGLPKFKNYHEDHQGRLDFAKAIENKQPILYTEKLDGSLVIRSVINGEVFWRTRGLFGTEENELLDRARSYATSQHPGLSDPEFAADNSLHFEFMHPEHKIILPVNQPSLTMISGVSHHSGELLSFDEIRSHAADVNVHTVEVHDLSHNEDELLRTIAGWKNSEGIVIRFDNEQQYLKIKSEGYLAQHRLKSGFTPERALKLCRQVNFNSDDAFIDHLYSLGMDWEVAAERVRYLHLYDEISTCWQDKTQDLEEFLNTFGDIYANDRRKFAQLVNDAYSEQDMKNICFTVASGKSDFSTASEYLLTAMLNRAVSR